MTYKACTFGTANGPCHTMPSVAAWTEKGTAGGKRIWVCKFHDELLDKNLRKAEARSGWRRTAFKASDIASATGEATPTSGTGAETARGGTKSATAAATTSRG